MTWWVALLCGAGGGFAVEALDFIKASKRVGDWPWRVEGEPKLGPYLVAVVLRVAIGVVVSWVSWASQQVDTPLAAFAIGVAAPLIVERLQRGEALVPPGPAADAGSGQGGSGGGSQA